jgi:Tol biopolymer transport system component
MTSLIPRGLIVLTFVSMFSMALSGCMPKGGLSDQIEFTRLDPGGTYSYRDPVWSPDSSKIAYTRFEVYDHPRAEKITTGEIFVMDVTTRQTTQLTHSAASSRNQKERWPVVVR